MPCGRKYLLRSCFLPLQTWYNMAEFGTVRYQLITDGIVAMLLMQQIGTDFLRVYYTIVFFTEEGQKPFSH